MTRQRPTPLLQPFVETLWASPAGRTHAPREHSLPTGHMHLAIRLDGDVLRLYSSDVDTVGHAVSDAVVGGIRTHYCIKDTSRPVRSVGAMLRPGAAQALFGCSAEELAQGHVPLELLWKPVDTARLRERLQQTNDVAAQIQLLEAAMLAQLRCARGLHPQVARALEEMERGRRVADLVKASHVSHRHFIALFRESTGLSPKRYARLLRLQRLLRDFGRARSWTDAALAAGYSDQAHFNREFRAFAGMTPQAYRRKVGAEPHHVPVMA